MGGDESKMNVAKYLFQKLLIKRTDDRKVLITCEIEFEKICGVLNGLLCMSINCFIKLRFFLSM